MPLLIFEEIASCCERGLLFLLQTTIPWVLWTPVDRNQHKEALSSRVCVIDWPIFGTTFNHLTCFHIFFRFHSPTWTRCLDISSFNCCWPVQMSVDIALHNKQAHDLFRPLKNPCVHLPDQDLRQLDLSPALSELEAPAAPSIRTSTNLVLPCSSTSFIPSVVLPAHAPSTAGQDYPTERSDNVSHLALVHQVFTCRVMYATIHFDS